MDVTSLVSALFGISALGGGVFVAADAKSKQRTAEARRNAAEARKEELELRLAEEAEKAQKSRAPREKTNSNRDNGLATALKEREAALASAARERDSAVKRATSLQAELEELRVSAAREQKRLLDERRRLEADYEASLADLKQIATVVGAAAVSASPAPPPPPAPGIPISATLAATPIPPSPVGDDPSGASIRLPRPKAGLPANGARQKARESVRLLLAAPDVEASDLADAVSAAGYTLDKATTAAEMLRVAREFRPAMIVLDAQLSKRGGEDPFAVLLNLKNDDSLRDIPVVMICPLKDRERATEMGAVGCVGAPAASNVLLGAINAAFVANKKRAERSRLAQTAKTSVG